MFTSVVLGLGLGLGESWGRDSPTKGTTLENIQSVWNSRDSERKRCYWTGM